MIPSWEKSTLGRTSVAYYHSGHCAKGLKSYMNVVTNGAVCILYTCGRFLVAKKYESLSSKRTRNFLLSLTNNNFSNTPPKKLLLNAKLMEMAEILHQLCVSQDVLNGETTFKFIQLYYKNGL